MNLKAKDIIIAISCTGKCILFKNANDFSNPSDKSLGVVVNVKTDVLNTKNVNLNVKNPPVINPSLVILIIQNVMIGVPGVNKIFNTIVNTSKNNIPFIPFIIFANGTLDIFIIILGVFSDEEKGHAWQAFVTYNPGNRKPPRIIGHKP